MRMTKMLATAALAAAAAGAVLGVTALPAAAADDKPKVSVAGMSKSELMQLCARLGGTYEDLGGYGYYCSLADGTLYWCMAGENCVIYFVRPSPTPPISRPTVNPSTTATGGGSPLGRPGESALLGR